MTDPPPTPQELNSARRDLYLSVTLLGVSLLYAVWPMDIIPDVAPVIGWVDDAGLLTLAALKSGISYRRLKRKSALAESQKD